MDANLLFWCGAWLDLGLVVACAALGVRHARRGQLRLHRRLMLTAASLVGVFLVAYALKLLLLGREDRSQWTSTDHAVLYVHELCVAAMLLGGVLAGWRARSFRARLGPRFERPPGGLPEAEPHRRAGWLALWGAAAAFATASAVLAGMFQRAGG